MAFNKMSFDSQTIEFSATDKQKLINGIRNARLF